MGYDVHITRADDWVASQRAPITLAEWLAFVERDPEMRLLDAEGVIVRRFKGETDHLSTPEGLAAWTAHPGRSSADAGVWFDLHNDRIDVKNPDGPALQKMKQIAGHFGARVVGDDGELY